jgi:hypothetical protein
MRGHTVTIYDLLTEHEDGLTTAEIVEITGIKYTSVFNAVNRNNFFYIDRWTINRKSWHWVAVWRLASDGDINAPQPEIRPVQYLRAQERRAA